MTLHVVFPAAGIGSRFGASIPKQYVNIAGKTIMEWTLLAWQNIPVDGYKIVVKSSEDQYCTQVLSQINANFKCVDGGCDRSDSVLNALHYLMQHDCKNDWVMVHDIARPCVSQVDIEALRSACIKYNQGGILAKPISDTIKQVQANHRLNTIDRTSLWAALTPQCFRVGVLLDALESAKAESIAVTDEASAIEHVGLAVQIIEGSAHNIKLTRSEDAELVQFYLQQQKRITHV